MKAVRCKAFGELSNLILEDVPSLPPSDGEVRIAVHAVGLNPADAIAIAGQFQLPPTLPFCPGFEAAGEVIESKAANLQPGTRVLLTLFG